MNEIKPMKESSDDFLLDIVNSDPGLSASQVLIIAIIVIFLVIVGIWLFKKM